MPRGLTSIRVSREKLRPVHGVRARQGHADSLGSCPSPSSCGLLKLRDIGCLVDSAHAKENPWITRPTSVE